MDSLGVARRVKRPSWGMEEDWAACGMNAVGGAADAAAAAAARMRWRELRVLCRSIWLMVANTCRRAREVACRRGLGGTTKKLDSSQVTVE